MLFLLLIFLFFFFISFSHCSMPVRLMESTQTFWSRTMRSNEISAPYNTQLRHNYYTFFCCCSFHSSDESMLFILIITVDFHRTELPLGKHLRSGASKVSSSFFFFFNDEKRFHIRERIGLQTRPHQCQFYAWWWNSADQSKAR